MIASRLPRGLPQRGRGSPSVRQLVLVRELTRANDWVSLGTLSASLYGDSVTSLHRDLHILQRAGIPVDFDGGKLWRLRLVDFVAWLTGPPRAPSVVNLTERLLALLPASSREIGQQLHRSPGDVASMMQRLLRAGRVHRTGRGRWARK